MNPISVSHHAGAYLIEFVSLREAVERLPSNSVVVTDDNVRRAWGHLLPSGLPVVVVRPGEASKSLQCLGEVVEGLVSARANRSTTVVALGGGVVGDLAGLVAATFMRGVPLVQVPTSLLAQVDSSVGGKVAIDTPQGKNLVGAFYPPRAVWVALEALSTLPPRHFVNGMSEVWKYGFILDPALVRTLGTGVAGHYDEGLGAVVRRCIELKAQVVADDEYDTSGVRAILNFGHTIGHAIEHVTGYGEVLHGEAVAIGMVFEAILGEQIGCTELGTAQTVRDCLVGQGLPVDHACLSDGDAMVAAMWRDKKVEAGGLGFSLLRRLGECKLASGVPEAEVRAALKRR